MTAVLLHILAFQGFTQNFPPMTVTIRDSAASEGYYFLSPYSNLPPFIYDRPHLILDRYGRVVFYQIFEAGPYENPTLDFKVQPDGRMSYFDINRVRFFFMDSTFTIVDSIRCTNGFATDQHDVQVVSGNHYLLFGKEIRIMNLTSYHWFGVGHNLPGSATAEVSGVVIQEFDADKNLVWEWKSHDHYQFADVDQNYLMNPNKVDWTHANSVELDQDGNVLVSLRHFNEITKIDHATGEIIWRLGGKQNQFAFPDDPVGFSGQHDIRRVSDTSVSMLDNGEYTTPSVCRALEYALDETNKVAHLAWEYIYDSSMSSLACGGHHYSANGNHVVDFGFTSKQAPWMVVVTPEKEPVLEVSMAPSYISYRAFNYSTLPWSLNRPAVECEEVSGVWYLVAEPGHEEYLWSTGETTRSIPVTDTGTYMVLVPRGKGYMASEYLRVTDPGNPCSFTGRKEPGDIADARLSCIPNPASGQVKVLAALPADAEVSLDLVTMQGRKVRNLYEGKCQQGTRDFSADLTGVPAGIYLIVLNADGFRVVSRLVIL